MNGAYGEIIQASDADRAGLFAGAAARLGTPLQNVEKDFWVCWTLDALFNGLAADSPRLLFKGGTSLSKAFGLISRFSEDIDITVFREDIGQEVDPAALEALSGKQRHRRLDAIRDACCTFINGPLAEQLTQRVVALGDPRLRLERDPDDPDEQTLLLRYPPATMTEGYIRSAVKIEAGAKSALDPHTFASIVPYVAQDLPDLDLCVGNITTVEAGRTFWDKIIILHGLRQWFERRGVLRHGGQRVSRHYYDVHQLLRHEQASKWLENQTLATDCARHARLFFGSPDLSHETAVHGSFTLMPSPAMEGALRADYTAMSGMIFGGIPSLDEVLASIERAERTLNA
ncbi:nucleotidyl transferase AbiEii/AbiGii toxin family protein [Ideonella sp. B7]|uniref:nucleotidyl transferase AbiEii/AbiGii toxin family protein n=1 Tax=Ideonella benzenivorans TaxID=2831643 RepID=UPI001CECE18E|nr:nucleotidyl transferase AbiEii/AbiGii toxin family protein [Ideonella benzenivorans]MCA6215190.1 nucleotidyl transferase AbiEii/AbiGii toxin family protein [Ideonella benzenivorans]